MRDASAARPGSDLRLLRLSLGGTQGAGDLISDLSRRFSLDINLIQARIEDVQGIAVGTAFVLVQGAPQVLEQALNDLAARDVAVQELAHEPATDRPSHYIAA
jgi:D-methionine transport system ATP-binding protein